MMENYYTDEKNILIMIALLKEHGIRRVIVSPGAMNITFVASIQRDAFFKIYSAVDERSAAYMACGLAVESEEPVVLSCTGATASRNYIPGLTEAYYRKIPVLAITSMLHEGQIGHNMPQVIDRTQIQKDIAKLSVHIPTVHTEEDVWNCEMKINAALLELKRQGGGPVHINLVTQLSRSYLQQELPSVRMIERMNQDSIFPPMPKGKIAVYVGAHKCWSKALVEAVDTFCESYNGVVLCDHTSNYFGKYGVFASLPASQDQWRFSCCLIDLMIHIGDVSGTSWRLFPKEVWRVNPDGEIRDTFHKLRYVYEMEEITFFQKYNELSKEKRGISYYAKWAETNRKITRRIPELPFSNVWIAQNTIQKLPSDCVLYIGILNSLRSWNFFNTRGKVRGYSNTGGFGIDGGISSLVGASLADFDTLCFGIVGDLAFFYDMNAIGNRHIGSNLRIMVINNGKGTEFRNYYHQGNQFGDEADRYIAGAGHFGNKSKMLLKHYAQDLGFEYLSAENKAQYQNVIDRFVSDKIGHSMILEIFTDSQDESDALKAIRNIETQNWNKNDIYELLGRGEKKRIGIYAVSKIAKKIIKIAKSIKELDKTEIFIYDSNPDIQGNYVENCKVLSPEDIELHYLDCLIIASDLYYDEIYEKYKFLEERGIQIKGVTYE